MPRLHKYVGEDRCYVKHSYRSGGRNFIVTYQVDEHAELVFSEKRIQDGDAIPDGVFRALRGKGHLFTQGGGAEGEEVEIDEGDDDVVRNFSFRGLSPAAGYFILHQLLHHPATKVTMEDTDVFAKTGVLNIQDTDKLTDDYMGQLFEIARLIDGTDFFKNLMASLERMPLYGGKDRAFEALQDALQPYVAWFTKTNELVYQGRDKNTPRGS